MENSPWMEEKRPRLPENIVHLADNVHSKTKNIVYCFNYGIKFYYFISSFLLITMLLSILVNMFKIESIHLKLTNYKWL